MNEQTIGSGDEASLSIGTLLGNMEGAHLLGTLKERWITKEGVEEISGDGCLSPLGNLGGKTVYWEFYDTVGGLRKGSISVCGSSVRGT